MTGPAALEWVESTNLSTAIREGALLYPIIGGFHLLAIALFGGRFLLKSKALFWLGPFVVKTWI